MQKIINWLRSPRRDPRSGRLIVLIECLLNQNARDAGAASSAAITREVVELLTQHNVGMLQIPCPEIACLGFRRQRPRGTSIRAALHTPQARQSCRSLALAEADRIQGYLQHGFQVLAVLGGNAASPGCAVHARNDEAEAAHRAEESGIFMQELAGELERRGIRLPFRGMRDADPALFRTDLHWLRQLLREV